MIPLIKRQVKGYSALTSIHLLVVKSAIRNVSMSFSRHKNSLTYNPGAGN